MCGGGINGDIRRGRVDPCLTAVLRNDRRKHEADWQFLAWLRRPRSKNTCHRGLDDDGGLFGFELEQGLVSLDRVAFRFEQTENDSVHKPFAKLGNCHRDG
jgi:hypothetical protein